MNIGIDARMYNQSGIGRYIRNLISNLKIIDTNNIYYIFLQNEDYLQFKSTRNFNKVEANFSWYGFSEQLRFPKLLNHYDLDLVHFPHFNVPLLYKKPFIVTIHDLIHQHYLSRRTTTKNLIYSEIKQLSYQKIFSNATNRSQKILVPSKYIKNQLITETKVKSDKIFVTYEAVDESLIGMSIRISKDEINKILNKFNISQPFLFYLGNAQPHKNIERLIRVFQNVKKNYPDLSLVLSGPESFFWNRIKKESLGVKGLIFTKFITELEMVGLYKSAAVFILPSLEEGFGLPILEAMACSCPVVASNSGSLPEIGGSAVIYFNPQDETDMQNKILLVLNDQKTAKKLISKGLDKYREYNWSDLTKITLDIYLQALERI